MLACTLSLTVCPPAGGPAGAIFRPAVGLPWRPTEDVKLINPAIGCLGIPSSRSLASRRGFSSSPTGGKGLRDSCEAVRGDFTNMIHSLFLAPQTLSGRCYLGGVPSPSFFLVAWHNDCFTSAEGCALQSCTACLQNVWLRTAIRGRLASAGRFPWRGHYQTGSDAQVCQPKA